MILIHIAWFFWQLPVAILEDYGVLRGVVGRHGARPPRLWAFRMACWANLDAGWAALTRRPRP